MKNPTVKEMFKNDLLVIKKIIQGYNGQVRIDCKPRFPNSSYPAISGKWCTSKYANKLALEYYGKELQDFNCFKY